MRVAYVLYPEAIVINKSNGIRNQAIKWAKSLDGLAQVDLVSPWDVIDWNEYDIVHFFGGTQWLGFVPDLLKFNKNVIFSPILDTIESKKKLKFFANLGFKGYHHQYNIYKQYLHVFKKILVRSEYEAGYFRDCFGVASHKIAKVPISYELDVSKLKNQAKESFCLHVSAIYQERKNVRRLIESAKKYGFKLVLAGNPGNLNQQDMIKKWIGGDGALIDLMGFVSTEELYCLYSKAKVFALPSINEGVGIVALNAAVAGCDVVLTNIGGPKEYYNGYARLVDPYDIDSIGQAIHDALSSTCADDLKKHIIEEYSQETVGKRLYDAYQKIVTEA